MFASLLVSLSLQNHVPGSSCRGPPGHGVRPAPGLLTAVQPGSPVSLASPSTRPSRQPAPLRPSCCRGEDAGHREPGAMRRRGACQWGPRRTPEARVPPQRAGSPQWSELGWSPRGRGGLAGGQEGGLRPPSLWPCRPAFRHCLPPPGSSPLVHRKKSPWGREKNL